MSPTIPSKYTFLTLTTCLALLSVFMALPGCPSGVKTSTVVNAGLQCSAADIQAAQDIVKQVEAGGKDWLGYVNLALDGVKEYACVEAALSQATGQPVHNGELAPGMRPTFVQANAASTSKERASFVRAEIAWRRTQSRLERL
jgi:hypothetical protein